jgi:TPR repeat protein
MYDPRCLSGAFDMYVQAAEKGHQQAMCSAGYMGIRLALNQSHVALANAFAADGLSWLRKAAVHDIKDAHFHLGCLFESGTLVGQDTERALNHYLAALGSSHVQLAPPLSQDGQCLHPVAAFRVAQILYARGGQDRAMGHGFRETR